jgi:hypothetical protein
VLLHPAPPPQTPCSQTHPISVGGAHVNEVDLTTKGTWSQAESKMSINILELKAVLLGVKYFWNRLKNQRVSLFSDKCTVVTFGNREVHICRMTWELLHFCYCENIVLVPEAHTRETQHTGRRPFQIEQASLHGVDTTHVRGPSSSRSGALRR